ncbi:MAG TPA: DUF3857 domain-containing protein [Puia sp.]
MICRILLILLCFSFQFALANEKVKISPEPHWLDKTNPDLNKKPSEHGISDGYYLELVEMQINLSNNTEYHHFIRQIVNESGVQNGSEVSVTFSPEFQQVLFHEVFIFRDGIKINQLNPGKIKIVQEETDAADFQYNGIKRAFITLTDVRKGDRVEVSYSIVGRNPVFDNKYFNTFYFYSNTEVCNYFIRLFSNQTRKLIFKSFNNAEAPSESVQGDMKIYQWNNPVLKISESATNTPSWFSDHPYVSVSEYNSWEDVSNWGLHIFNNYQYNLPDDLIKKIAAWHKTAGTDKDNFTNLALRFVQDQVRYLGLEIGEYTHHPHDPAEVYNRRFGDCKDKALLLATILRHEDIPAFVALVNTNLKDKLPDASPSAGEFDHAIVAIQRGKDYLFVDPTMSYQRGELINLFIPDYGYALIISENQNSLQRIEPGFLYTTLMTETLNVKYNDTVDFLVATTYEGGAADNARNTFAEISQKELNDNYKEYYSKIFDDIQIADDVERKDDSLKNEVTVYEKYLVPNLWHINDKGKRSFDVFAKAIYEDLPDPSSSEASTPLAIKFPEKIFYDFVINMPDTWAFNENEVHFKNDSYKFDFVPEVAHGNQIILKYSLQTFKDNIASTDLIQYKKDYKIIVNALQFQFYRNTEFTNPANDNSNVKQSLPPPAPANWVAIWFTFIFVGLYVLLLMRLNKRSEEVLFDPKTGWPLGGWTIILGITIGLSIILNLISLVKSDYFSYESWITLKNTGGAKLQYILLTELGVSLFWTIGAVALIYWYVERRDIFPKMFISFVMSIFAGEILLFILYSTIHNSFSDLPGNAGIQIVRTCIYAAIWITYVLRSARVKCTFLQPYKKEA